jgi:hypothetical protein
MGTRCPRSTANPAPFIPKIMYAILVVVNAVYRDALVEIMPMELIYVEIPNIINQMPLIRYVCQSLTFNSVYL